MQLLQSRRHFLASTSSAMAAGLVGARVAFANEPPPEVTTLRLPREPNICIAPVSIAEALLRAEGFTEIHYVPDTTTEAVGSGEVDFDLFAAPMVVSLLDAGLPVTTLAGVHSGCYELFAHDRLGHSET